METVYYDTADLRLARWGVSLRRRAGEGWTLKLAQPPSTPGKPGAVLERDELTFQGGAAKPPEATLEVVRAYVRKAELVPVARLSTVRRRGRHPERHCGVGRRTSSSRAAGQDRPRARGDTSGARGDAQAAVESAHVWRAAGPGVDRAHAFGAGVACDGPWRGA